MLILFMILKDYIWCSVIELSGIREWAGCQNGKSKYLWESNLYVFWLHKENINIDNFRDDAPEKDADVDANEAKEGDGQGYVLYWMIPF